MNEKREVLSAAERRALKTKAAFYEALGFPALAPLIKKFRAELATDDQARLHKAAATMENDDENNGKVPKVSASV